MPRSTAYQLKALTVEVVEGSIASPGRRLDALVSSDDNYLSHGGGVSAALWEAAGPALPRSLEGVNPSLSLGDVHVTGAGALPARFLLHAITIDFDANRTIAAPHLPFLYGEVFRMAASRGCETLGLPLLAAGAAGVSHVQSARAFLEAIRAVPEVGHWGSVFLFLLPEVASAVRALLDAELRGRGAGWDIARILKKLPRAVGTPLLEQWLPNAKVGVAQRIPTISLLEALADVGRASAEEAHLWDPTGERLRGAVAELRMVRARLDQGKGPLTHAEGRAAEDALRGLVQALTELHKQHRPLASEATPLERSRPSRKRAAAREASQPAEVSLQSKSIERIDKPRPLGLAAPALPSISPQAEGGTSHVRALHRLILERLPSEHLERLQKRLENDGYSGEPEFRLLEHLVSHQDPVRLVTEFFDVFALGSILEAYGATSPESLSHTQTAERVLEMLGFHPPRKARGLDAARKAVNGARDRLRLAQPGATAIRGDVLEAGTWLECACQVLLRFVSQVLFERPPEVLLREFEVLKPGEDLAHAGLGRLFTLLDGLDNRIRKDPPPRFAVSGFSERPLLPEHGKGSLPGTRNHFAHFKPTEKVTPADDLRRAREFADGVARLLDYLAVPEHRVFPRVLRITEIRYDRWSRRLAQAEAEDGRTETIFTDGTLRPGEIYFMHPLSNPIRVDPLLIPAGDFAFPETE